MIIRNNNVLWRVSCCVNNDSLSQISLLLYPFPMLSFKDNNVLLQLCSWWKFSNKEIYNTRFDHILSSFVLVLFKFATITSVKIIVHEKSDKWNSEYTYRRKKTYDLWKWTIILQKSRWKGMPRSQLWLIKIDRMP